MNCIYFKKRTKKGLPYLFCSFKRDIIDFSSCRYCCSKCYKKALKSPLNREKKAYSISSKSYKLKKLENSRFSIITADMDHCIICGKNKQHLHEVCFGRNRLNSIKYGLVIPVCLSCHQLIHSDSKLQEYWHVIAQERFEETYSESFIDVFHINYRS